MSWAARRRFFILLIIGAVVIAFLAVLSIATFYKTPTCTDGVKNQDEDGIDCGGSCAYLCTEQMYSPTVLFTKALQYNSGRTDVIAMIENKNAAAAAKNVQYRITLYGAGQSLVQQVTGTLDLPAGARVPIYAPGITSGKQKVVNAFLDVIPSSLRWFTATSDVRVVPIVLNTKHTGASTTPRIEAILSNQNISAMTSVKVVILVRNESGDVIAASSTIVPSIPPQGQATAAFTWNSEFTSALASIEVVPIIPLP
ncbi:hypothetical protein HY412_02460 [Candidatus Kaiserbacteria bacterium]|nr:hypothetical protein [Candidatus Kaiserbacteria bacterium]